MGYAHGCTVTTGVVRSELASAASFTGTSVAGALGAEGSDNYAFTIRESEMAGTPSGTVILRVATTGDVLPVIAGLEPLASAMSGGTRVTLFAITEPGLFQLTVAGSGAYDLELGIAGEDRKSTRLNSSH